MSLQNMASESPRSRVSMTVIVVSQGVEKVEMMHEHITRNIAVRASTKRIWDQG